MRAGLVTEGPSGGGALSAWGGAGGVAKGRGRGAGGDPLPPPAEGGVALAETGLRAGGRSPRRGCGRDRGGTEPVPGSSWLVPAGSSQATLRGPERGDPKRLSPSPTPSCSWSPLAGLGLGHHPESHLTTAGLWGPRGAPRCTVPPSLAFVQSCAPRWFQYLRNPMSPPIQVVSLQPRKFAGEWGAGAARRAPVIPHTLSLLWEIGQKESDCVPASSAPPKTPPDPPPQRQPWQGLQEELSACGIDGDLL